MGIMRKRTSLLPVECAILLESGRKVNVIDGEMDVHYPGQSVYGKVSFVVTSSQIFEALDVRISGEAHTHISAGSKSFSGYENYFMDVFPLGKNLILEPGNHLYPFSFNLPIDMPYTFKHKNGYILFEISVVNDDEKIEVIIADIELFIVSNINLDLYHPKIKEPVKKEIYDAENLFKNCACCEIVGDLSLEMSIPCSGYCPNQIIPITFNCKNHTNAKTIKFFVTLEKSVAFKKTPGLNVMKIVKEDLVKIVSRDIKKQENVTFQEHLIIPSNATPSELGSGIIEITYRLKVSVHAKGYKPPPPNYFTKIIIGDIPITEMVDKLGPGKRYWETENKKHQYQRTQSTILIPPDTQSVYPDLQPGFLTPIYPDRPTVWWSPNDQHSSSAFSSRKYRNTPIYKPNVVVAYSILQQTDHAKKILLKVSNTPSIISSQDIESMSTVTSSKQESSHLSNQSNESNERNDTNASNLQESGSEPSNSASFSVYNSDSKNNIKRLINKIKRQVSRVIKKNLNGFKSNSFK